MALMYIQSNWVVALEQEDGKAWVTLKKRGQKGERALLKQMGPPEQPFVTSTSSDFSIGKVERGVINLKFRGSELVFKMVAPSAEFNSIHLKSVSGLDVSSGGLGVSCGDDGLHVWETNMGLMRRSLEGHLGDIYSVQLFPSGVVVLSCGSDMRIKIWSASTGSCPVTLSGHTGAVTQTCIVDVGKNIVSVSKDGSVRLWSCGKGKCIEPIIQVSESLNCVDIIESSLNTLDMQCDNLDDDEVGTTGKMLAAGSESGSVHLIDLRGRKVIDRVRLGSPVNRVKFVDEWHVLAGCQDGSVAIYSTFSMENVARIHDSDSGVASLFMAASLSGFIVGRYDGACTWYGLQSGDNKLEVGDERVSLTGSDVDPVNAISADSEHVYTGSRDGIVRKYRIKAILS